MKGQAGDVAVIAVGTDPSQTAEEISTYQENQGYEYAMAVAHPDILRSYQVASQSTKVGVDRNGVVQVREGFGTKNQGWWSDVFSRLADSEIR